MRTNLTLDSELVEKLQKETGCSTKAKAVVLAIEDFLRWKKVEQVMKYKGKIKFRKDTALARKKIR